MYVACKRCEGFGYVIEQKSCGCCSTSEDCLDCAAKGVKIASLVDCLVAAHKALDERYLEVDSDEADLVESAIKKIREAAHSALSIIEFNEYHKSTT